MRFIIFGAGAVGSIIGGHLARTGHSVVLVGRQAHVEAINARGLRLWRPEKTYEIRVPAVTSLAALAVGSGDVILLCVKGQHTAGALAQIASAAGPDIPIFCCQNGVVNEELAARSFAHVYGVVVNLPGQYHAPGEVYNALHDFAGNLGVGCHPSGLDELAVEVDAALRRATFRGAAFANVMAYKWRKYLGNLANAVGAITDGQGDAAPVLKLLRDEAWAVIRAAGIEVVTQAAYEVDMGISGRRRADPPLDRSGGSSWQSLHRRTGSIETRQLNGYIAELAARQELAAPANARITEIAEALARDREPPGRYTAEQLLALLSE